MYRRSVFLVLFVLSVALCRAAESADETTLEVGDTVTTLRETRIKRGREILATVPPKTEFLVISVNGDWGGVEVQRNGKEVSGWIYAKHVRPITTAAAGADYPLALHVKEGKGPGDPPKLFYSRRQAENVLGTKLPKSGLMGFGFLGGGGLSLQVIQSKDNPRVTGKLQGTLGIMSMTADIPIVLKTLPKGFHGAALSGTRKGDDAQSQLSPWVVFEVK